MSRQWARVLFVACVGLTASVTTLLLSSVLADLPTMIPFEISVVLMFAVPVISLIWPIVTAVVGGMVLGRIRDVWVVPASIIIAEGLGVLMDPLHEGVRIAASDLVWTTASATFATGVAALIVIMRSRIGER